MRKISTSDNESNNPIAILNEHFSPVTAACFITNGPDDYLVTGSLCGDIFVNDLSACRCVLKLKAAHSNKVVSLRALSSTNYRFLSQGRDGLIYIYKAVSDNNSKINFVKSILTNCSQLSLTTISLVDFVDFVLAAFVSPDNDILVSVRYNHLECKKSFGSDVDQSKSGKSSLITSVKLSNSKTSKYLFIGNDASTLECHSVFLNTETEELNVKLIDIMYTVFEKEPIICIDFDMNRCEGVLGSSCDQIVTFKLTDTSLVRLHAIILANPGTSCITLREDYKLCVASGWDHRIRIFKWPTMKPLKVLYFHNDSIDCVVYSHKHSNEKYYFAVCCNDGLVTVWDFYNYKVVAE